MKFWLFVFFVVALVANSVVADHGLESNSKQLMLMPVKAESSSSLIIKTEANVTGFIGIAKKYATSIVNLGCMSGVKAKLTGMSASIGNTKAGTAIAAWKAKNPQKYAGLALAGAVTFAVGDAVASVLIVAACPPLVGILIGDAVIELAKAVYDLGGGGDADAQEARVAYQGLSLILAIGGIDGAAGTNLAEAMGEFYHAGEGSGHGVLSNLAGEATDAAGAALTPKEKTDSGCTTCTTKKDLADARNAKLQAKFTGQTVTLSNGKKRKLVYAPNGNNPSDDKFKAIAAASLTA